MPDKIKVIVIGDIVGKLGRTVVDKILPKWKKLYQPDLIIANVENLAHGKGVTAKSLEQISKAGVQLFTGGNHVWKKTDPSISDIQDNYSLSLPANDARTLESQKYQTFSIGSHKIFVINLLGRAHMVDEVDNPFRTFDNLYTKLDKPQLVIVDMHAEFTSEKIAFSKYVDGRASLVVGTHTHIATADARIWQHGTGYVTDIGMTGSDDSVIGVSTDVIIKRFLEESNETFTYPEAGLALANAIYCEIEGKSGTCLTIKHLYEQMTI